MGAYNNCGNIYDEDITTNELCNVNHYRGEQPYGDYNALGELDGYYWNYGDTINLSFHIDGELTVESDAIIYSAIGEEPTEETVGEIDQRAYNVVDLKSWTCVSIDDGKYTWEKDEEFTYPLDGGKTLYVTAREFLNGKSAKITIYNFRYEKVFETTLDAAPIISYSIDKETSEIFGRGTYYLTLQVFDKASLLYISVIKDKECTITVR